MNLEDLWRQKFTSPILEVGSKGGPYTRRYSVKTKLACKKYNRKQEENSSYMSAFSFSSWHVVSLYSANVVDSTSILTFSPGDYLQGVVMNKPVYSELRQSFQCSFIFSTPRLQQVSTTTIVAAIRPLTYSSTSCYECLFVIVI